MGGKRVLIVTLSAIWGGVPSMISFILKTLIARGYEPVIAYYEPYGFTPHLSVPICKLLHSRPWMKVRKTPEGCDAFAVGA